MIGKHLQHPNFGSCVVRKVISRTEVEVEYLDLEISDRCRLAVLIDPDSGEAPSAASFSPNSATNNGEKETVSMDATSLQARLAILALRLGQCPEAYIDDLTVGSKEVKDACGWALDRSNSGQPAIVVFESPFGKGKTHALNLFSSMARKQFRAVGSVVLDGFGISLTQPMTLLSNLAASIRFPEEQGFETLPERLCELVQKGKVAQLRSRGASFLASCLERVPTEIAEQPDAWEVVVDYLSCTLPASQAKQKLAGYRSHGGAPALPAIVANRLDERAPRCTKMLREWAQACTLVGAHRGLVVLLDEADVDYGNTGFGRSAVGQRILLYNAIRELAESDERSYLSIGIAITPGQDNYWGEEAIDEIMEHLGGECTMHVQLKDLTKRDFTSLGKKIAGLYADAFGAAVLSPVEATAYAEELRDRMSGRINDSCLPRRFIREYIEHLDLVALA
jgi:hypothetical protein